MKLFYRCEFGSKIYGTSVPESDTDYKGVYLPTKEQILLQRVPRVSVKNTKLSAGAKNEAGDIDDEMFSLQEYLKLLCGGNTPMIDMLFCPNSHVTKEHELWYSLVWRNRREFLTNGVSAFVSYTRTQAGKYSIKGSRVAASRATAEFLKLIPKQTATLGEFEGLIDGFVKQENSEFIQVLELLDKASGKFIKHLEVCGRKAPFTSKVKYAQDVFQKLFDAYGHRALLAENNESVDWKALYHAVRVGREAEELLMTGHITFPRPEATLLLQIRKGELPYKQVAELIEDGLLRIEAAKEKSTLRETSNLELADAIVSEIYEDIVKGKL